MRFEIISFIITLLALTLAMSITYAEGLSNIVDNTKANVTLQDVYELLLKLNQTINQLSKEHKQIVEGIVDQKIELIQQEVRHINDELHELRDDIKWLMRHSVTKTDLQVSLQSIQSTIVWYTATLGVVFSIAIAISQLLTRRRR